MTLISTNGMDQTAKKLNMRLIQVIAIDFGLLQPSKLLDRLN